MTKTEQTFRFGDFRLAVRGALPPRTEESYLWRFASEETQAQAVCEIELRREVPEPKGETLFSAPGRALFQTERGREIAFFATATNEKCYAVLTLASDASLRLTFASRCAETLEHDMLSCIAMEHLLLRHGHATFHAAWFERAGEAVMFTGDSGVGKSTHTNIWARERDVRVVNGDKALLLRRGDRFYAAGIPYAGSSGICRNRTLPIGRIVFLSHGKQNVLRRMPPREAVRALVSQMPVQKWCAEDISAAALTALELAQRVPIYAYACLPDASAVDYLENALFLREER